MKIIKVFLTIIFLITFCFGCSKDEDFSIADQATGIYEGSWIVEGSFFDGICEVVKVSSETVDLELELVGTTLPTLPDVELSGGDDGEIFLYYTDSSGSLTGNIRNKTISFLIDDGEDEISFIGTKN